MSYEIDLIWNISLVCPWDCEFCCTNAVQVKNSQKNIIMTSNGYIDCLDPCESKRLAANFRKEYPGIVPNRYDIALMKRVELGIEPSLDEKFKMVDMFESYKTKIDFAGGDPLVCYENFLTIKKAAEIHGRENISITTTGVGVGRYGVDKLTEMIGIYEFTYDEAEDFSCVNRPRKYNSSSLGMAKKFSALGVKTKAQVPIHSGNIGRREIKRIYNDLDSGMIDEILLMRLFPVGRGAKPGGEYIPSKADIISAVGYFKELSCEGSTKVRLQCALRHLFEGAVNDNPCDMIRSSFGINYQGKLLVSAWGNNEFGGPISEDFVLEDLRCQSFEEIKETSKFKRYAAKLDDNNGHCKVFSYINSGMGEEGFFLKSDPLYI